NTEAHSPAPSANRRQICPHWRCPVAEASTPAAEKARKYSPQRSSTGRNAAPSTSTAASASEPFSSRTAATLDSSAAAAASPTTGSAPDSRLLPTRSPAESLLPARSPCSPSTKLNSAPQASSSQPKQQIGRASGREGGRE